MIKIILLGYTNIIIIFVVTKFFIQMLDTIKTTAVGAAGIAGSMAADAVATPTGSTAEAVIKIVVQLIIGVLTVLQLVRPRKAKG